MADDHDRPLPGDDADRPHPAGPSRAMRAFVVTVLALSCAGYAATTALESVGSEPAPSPTASPTDPVPCGGSDTGLEGPSDAGHSLEHWENDRKPDEPFTVLCAVVRESDD